MYLIENWHKLLFVILLAAGYSVAASLFLQQGEITKTEQSLAQMSDDSGHTTEQLKRQHAFENNGYALGWLAVGFVVFLVFIDDLRKLFKGPAAAALPLAFVLALSGCRRPFEPVKLEVVAPAGFPSGVFDGAVSVTPRGSGVALAYSGSAVISGVAGATDSEPPSPWSVSGS